MDLRTPEKRLKEELEVSYWLKFNDSFKVSEDDLEPWKQSNHCYAILPEDFDIGLIQDILPYIFGDGEKIDREGFKIRHNVDMFDLLVEMKTFKSRSDARKNWTKSDQFIEEGISSFLVGKMNKPLYIWKPPAEFIDSLK
jgi:hypothetical protein